MDNQYLEKASSLLVGGAMTHLAQNFATNSALHSKTVAKYLANSFQQGYKGVVDKSIGGTIKRGLTSVALPDVSAAHKAAHEAGGAMKGLLGNATKKQHLGVRMVTQGRFSDLKKHGLDKDHVVMKAHALMKKHLPSVPSLSGNLKNVEKLWSDKSHPLLSNISKQISRGEVPSGKKFKPGKLTQTTPVAASLASAVVDPAAGVMNTAKAVSMSKVVQDSKWGSKMVHAAHNQFIKKPVLSGVSNSGGVSGLKHSAYKYAVNPLSAHLKRTSSALSEAVK